MTSTPEITVYSRPGCQPCKATIKKLNSLGADYRKVDVTEDAEALDYIKSLGYLQAPVVVAGGEHWAGYSPDRITEAVAAWQASGQPDTA
ncbi:glutaredoxin family protein [Nocardia otitidiscaviarum]|uniref:glutaredoxin family protein n=1 Tax=Nocardia otitidiscaviarum TaxID=1823 RepID=UPI0004A6B1C8|nr:glutaredoxin family protein [Nocardia otitidiscaviarum]